MPLNFHVEVTPALARQATAGIFWRQARSSKVLGPALGLLALLGLLVKLLLPGAGWIVLGLVPLVVAGSMILAAWLVCGQAMELAAKNFVRFEGAPAQVTLTPGAYVYSATWGSGSIDWRDFQSLWRFEAVWVLLQHKAGGASVLLPSAALDDESRAYLELRLAEAGVEVMA